MKNDKFHPNNLDCQELEIINPQHVAYKNIQHTQRRPGGSGGPGGPGGPNFPNNPGIPIGPGFPGFPSSPGGSQPNFPGGQNRPNTMSPPSTPPPANVPILPRGIAIPLPETAEYAQLYNNTNRFNNMQWELRRCMNRFTFIWLWNGRSFWFFPLFMTGWTVEGFVWRGNRWVFDRIRLNNIFFFSCF